MKTFYPVDDESSSPFFYAITNLVEHIFFFFWVTRPKGLGLKREPAHMPKGSPHKWKKNRHKRKASPHKWEKVMCPSFKPWTPRWDAHHRTEIVPPGSVIFLSSELSDLSVQSCSSINDPFQHEFILKYNLQSMARCWVNL